jgi:hypothetical protein
MTAGPSFAAVSCKYNNTKLFSLPAGAFRLNKTTCVNGAPVHARQFFYVDVENT